MEQNNYEPFGERLSRDKTMRPHSSVSRYLLLTGSSVFWMLVGVIVLGRAIYFQPGIFDGFDRVAAAAGALLKSFWA